LIDRGRAVFGAIILCNCEADKRQDKDDNQTLLVPIERQCAKEILHRLA